MHGYVWCGWNLYLYMWKWIFLAIVTQLHHELKARSSITSKVVSSCCRCSCVCFFHNHNYMSCSHLFYMRKSLCCEWFVVCSFQGFENVTWCKKAENEWWEWQRISWVVRGKTWCDWQAEKHCALSVLNVWIMELHLLRGIMKVNIEVLHWKVRKCKKCLYHMCWEQQVLSLIKFVVSSLNVGAATFEVRESIGRHCKACSDGEFLKQAFLACIIICIISEICPAVKTQWRPG